MILMDHITSLCEFLPDAVVLTDGQGVITGVNRRAGELFRYDRQEMLGREVELLVPEYAREAHREHRSLYNRHRDVRSMGAGLKLMGRRKDGSRFPVDVSLSPVVTSAGTFIISVIRDTTERITLEEAMRESEERYRSLVELSPEAIVVHAMGRIIYVNDATVRLFMANSREEIIGKALLDFVPHEYLGAVRYRLEHPAAPGEERAPMLIRSRRRDGEEFFLEALASVVTNSGAPAGQIILRDITDRVRTEQELTSSREQLRELSTYLQSAREAERTSIARELHDELGGALTALKMDLAMFEDALQADDIRKAIVGRVDSMSALIDGTVKTMRRIITELRPVLLDSLGLNAAIGWHTEEFQNRTGLVCDVRMPIEDIAIDRERSTAVFRICQETLTNVARHAGATRVDIDLRVDRGTLFLTVRDNGRGISPEQETHSKSFGLLGMRERALIFGGEVTVRGTPGQGTTVALTLPIPDPP